MDKTQIIRRMKEKGIKWKDISYIMDIGESAARMSLKRADDVAESEKPVIKR
jgi:hypothetical protein